MKPFATLLAVLLLARPVAAQNYPVATGPGLSTCAQFEHLHHEDPAMVDAFFSWAEGYLSGLNDRYVGQRGAADLLPPNLSTGEQKTYLDGFCRQHPDAPYMQGVVALYEQMRRQQGLGPGTPPSATPPATPKGARR